MYFQVRTITCKISKIVYILLYISINIIVCLIKVMEFAGHMRWISSEEGAIGDHR